MGEEEVKIKVAEATTLREKLEAIKNVLETTPYNTLFKLPPVSTVIDSIREILRDE